MQPPLTDGDRRAYEEYAKVERFRPEETVDVDLAFDHEARAIGLALP